MGASAVAALLALGTLQPWPCLAALGLGVAARCTRTAPRRARVLLLMGASALLGALDALLRLYVVHAARPTPAPVGLEVCLASLSLAVALSALVQGVHLGRSRRAA